MSALADSISTWVNAGLAFVYPETCQLCELARATPADGFVCADCWLRVHFIKPPFCERCGLPFPGEISAPFECANCRELELHFRSARSAVVARDPVLEVIHRYKYHGALWFEPFLAGLLIRQAPAELAREKWDFIVPIPLHPRKQREREFNQAERLARHLSAATHIPVHSRLLRRVVHTRTQTLLSRQERQANVRDAFALCRSASLQGRRIVLLDDVMTTGATTNAAAKTLRAAGAAEVCVWTVARGV
ncbi:putative Competence protein F [Verrucomicrobia bacterium]|nr:putative Competence protein F [Verrucomicrobiota bacterium]